MQHSNYLIFFSQDVHCKIRVHEKLQNPIAVFVREQQHAIKSLRMKRKKAENTLGKNISLFNWS